MDPRAVFAIDGGEDPSLYPPLGPVVVPAELLARHYARVPGGILNALADAAAYEGNPVWAAQASEESYMRPVRVSTDDIKNRGEFTPGNRMVTLRAGASNARPVVEHEATHAALLSGMPLEVISGSQMLPLRGVPSELAGDATQEDYIRYLLTPAEIDARLAEVKRMYAREKGVLVDDAKKAADAMQFYRDNYDSVSPQNEPTLGDDYKVYDAVPGLIDELLRRMPGVVDAGGPSAVSGLI